MITSEWPTSEHPEWAPFLVQQVKSLKAAGIDVVVYPFRGGKNPFNYLKAWIRLRQLYTLKEFDLIHAQFGQSGLLALGSKLPLVVTFHGSDLQGYVGERGEPMFSGFLLQVLSRYIARCASQRIVVSKHLTHHLPPDLHVHIIPCGVDLALFHIMDQWDARQQLGLPVNKHLLLFAANPDNPIKRYALAQQSVSLVSSQFDVELVTISDVPHEMVPVYMNACDALLMTSKHEGSPTVVKEALACNFPVVSVDVGDVRDRIEEIDGCVLCLDDSPQSIADGIVEVLKSRRRTKSREHITDLDEQEIAKQIIEVYRLAVELGTAL
jgi:glycosyltransferase involved in cell wall biosynthesis